jgi:hypothetical protein
LYLAENTLCFNYKDQSVSFVLDHAEYINTLTGKNAIFFTANPSGIYTDHWALNGLVMTV